MGKYQIGEFEEIVLLVVAALHGNAYGVTIKQTIEGRLSRKVSVGALQACLKRLEEKGYLSARNGEANAIRGGRPKRYFEITAYGKKVLEATREVRNQLWSEIPEVVLQLKIT